MNIARKIQYLRVALVFIGLLFTFGLYPLMHYWPSSWGWTPPQPEYEQMLLGIYATLGVFLLIASRNPMEHRSLIWFTVWSSVVHGGIMFVQALLDSQEYPNLYGDVPGLLMVALILAVLMPRKIDINRLNI